MKCYLKEVRRRRPLIHCITNIVTANDCANLLLAAGASPTMAHHPAEVEEVTAGCDALVCNLGATESYEAMEKAVIVSKRCAHPVVIDPVGAGGSKFRRDFFRRLLQVGQAACIRGNASEILALAENRSTVTGVDGGNCPKHLAASAAKELAERTGSIVIASGRQDIVTDGKMTYLIDNGDVWMTKITGSGCMSTALLGAYLAAADDRMKQGSGNVLTSGADGDVLAACAEAAAVMGICGELAAEECRESGKGSMSFRMSLIDRLFTMEEDAIKLKRRMTIEGKEKGFEDRWRKLERDSNGLN